MSEAKNLQQQPLFSNASLTQDNLSRSPVRFGVIGVGGGGCNAVQSMARFPWSDDIDFICIETDVQKLRSIANPNIIQVQLEDTQGQGAGMLPDNGRRAAEKSRAKLEQLLLNYQAVFLVSGMGGGTGTGATPVIANYACALKVLAVGVVTRPFSWETDRVEKAQKGVELLKERVDSLIVISNEKVEECFPGANYRLTLSSADDVLSSAVRSITNLVIKPGEINIDFADICHVLRSSRDNRLSLIGFGDSRDIKQRESNLLERTVELAIENPILEAYSLEGCTGLLINITTNSNAAFLDIKAVNNFLKEKLAGKTSASGFIKKTGFVIDDELDDGVIQVTVVAAGVTQSIPDTDADVVEELQLLRGGAPMQLHVNPNPPRETADLNPTSVHIGMNAAANGQSAGFYQQPDSLRRPSAPSGIRKKLNMVSTRDFIRVAVAQQSQPMPYQQRTPFLQRQKN